MNPCSGPRLTTPYDGLRKSGHSDVRSDVDSYQSNKTLRVPEILNIQNHVILLKCNSLFRWEYPEIEWTEVESSVITYLWLRHVHTKMSLKNQYSPDPVVWDFPLVTPASCRSPSKRIQLTLPAPFLFQSPWPSCGHSREQEQTEAGPRTMKGRGGAEPVGADSAQRPLPAGPHKGRPRLRTSSVVLPSKTEIIRRTVNIACSSFHKSVC